jgi:hypothetical protein
MLVKICLGIFFDFPIGDLAFLTGALVPFITKPAGGPAVPGFADLEFPVAVGGQFRYRALDLKILDPVKEALSRRPQLDLVQQEKEARLLSIILFFDILGHTRFLIPLCDGGESGSFTRLHGFRIHGIFPIYPPLIFFFFPFFFTARISMVATPIWRGS